MYNIIIYIKCNNLAKIILGGSYMTNNEIMQTISVMVPKGAKKSGQKL